MSTLLTRPCFVGLDVSKDKVDVFVEGKSATFSMQTLEQLVAFLLPFKPSWVVLEPTGGYELAVVKALNAAGIPVTRPHVTRMSHHAKGLGHYAKTDRLDAKALAHYAKCYGEELKPFEPDEQQELLRSLSQRKRQLIRTATQEKNRLHHGELPEETRQSVSRHLAWLKEEIQAVAQQLQALIAADQKKKEKQQLLESLAGVGPAVSAVLISEVPELGSLDRKAVATLIGVCPYERRSGKWKGKARIQGGRQEVRQTLYMAVLSGARYCPELKVLYERLIAKGKAKKVALVACMHKMLRMLNAMLTKGEAYHPQTG